MPRESAYGRLLRHFHEHPQGRMHEMLFWAGIGLVLGAIAWITWSQGWLSTPLALMLAIVSACFIGWAFLPRAREPATKKIPPGKRGELAKQKQTTKRPRR